MKRVKKLFNPKDQAFPDLSKIIQLSEFCPFAHNE